MSQTPKKDELDELLQFMDEHPDMTDADMEEMEKRFSKEAIATFTAAFLGITPE